VPARAEDGAVTAARARGDEGAAGRSHSETSARRTAPVRAGLRLGDARDRLRADRAPAPPRRPCPACHAARVPLMPDAPGSPPYTVRHTATGAELRLVGPLLGGHVRAGLDAVLARPGGRVPHYVLIDLSGAEIGDLSLEDARALAMAFRTAAGDGPPPLAAVAAAQPALFGLARMWEAFIAIGGVRAASHVAWSRATAIAWLLEHDAAAAELVP
jgi:hypothetical protein